METVDLYDLLERGANISKGGVTFPPGRQVLGASLYEGLLVVLTKETLAQMCKDEWTMAASWRVIPGQWAYKLVNSSAKADQPVQVEEWQLLNQELAEKGQLAETDCLGLKAARHLIVFDLAVLFALLKVQADPPNSEDGRPEGEPRPKPTRKIEMLAESGPEDPPRDAESPPDSPQGDNAADDEKAERDTAEGGGFSDLATGHQKSEAEEPATSREKQKAKSPPRETTASPRLSKLDRGFASRASADRAPRDPRPAATHLEVGAVVELKRAEPGVKIEKMTKS